MRLVVILWMLLLAGCWGAPLPQPLHGDNQSAMEAALDATVALMTPTGFVYCSGVAHRNLVITAAHCVDDVDEVRVGFRPDMDPGAVRFFRSRDIALPVIPMGRLPTGAGYMYAVAHKDDIQDLAVLVPLTAHEAPSRAPLARDGWWPGREVVVVGHPMGLLWSISTGVVSRERHGGVDAAQRWLQISAPVSPGNSGGPVFNRYGEILAVVSFRILGEPHLAGAVPVPQILEAIEAAEAATTTSRRGD